MEGDITAEKYYSFSCSEEIGHAENAECTDSGLCFSQNGLWISPAIDSGTREMRWDKAVIAFSANKSDYFRLTVLASDKNTISHNGEDIPLENALADLIKGKSDLLADISAVTFVNPTTIPLHSLRGRYLWIAAEFFPENESCITLNGISAQYPYSSYMSSLPEIFSRKDNGTLTDILALFKVITDETDSEITDFAQKLDPQFANGKDLERLLSWQGIGVTAIWEESVLRRLLMESNRLNRLKGTSYAISELFNILLGKPPVIAENNENYSFVVKLDYALVPSGRHHAELLRLLDDFSPAGIIPHLELVRSSADSIDRGIVLSDDDFGSGFVL